MALTKTTVEMMEGYDPTLDNLAIGKNALVSSSLDSTLNIAIGTGALQSATTSGGAEDGANTAVGRSAMQDLTTGYFNVAVGTTAGQSFTTAYNCTAIGRGAMAERAQGYDNTAIGREAMYGEIGTDATLHTAEGCVAVGVSALHDVIGGDRNSAFGRSALSALTSGNDNLALGYAAGNLMTTGSGNVIIGRYSGNAGGLDIRTSTNNIVFADGNANIRARADGSGNWYIGKTAAGLTDTGHELRADGQVYHTVDGSNAVYINRAQDGNLVQFYSAGAIEGSISVSGTTVSYNGGHLSRWSRLLDGDTSTPLKGTVMSNLDDMIVWTDANGNQEANEQLNHTKISDTEGDVNVAGVFVSSDTSDDNQDYYLGMTGDLVIRIASGTTVARGDLLMSAGDGTAKPQGDDIVRSKTIAKVTSTNVSHTYDDGSYLVPCVLMAC